MNLMVEILTRICSVIIVILVLIIGIKYGLLMASLFLIISVVSLAHVMYVLNELKEHPTYYEDWKRWSKKSLNGRFYKFLVLIGAANSPTFEIEKLHLENMFYFTELKDENKNTCTIRIKEKEDK